MQGGCTAIELGVAFDNIDWASQIMHDFGVRVHSRERRPVGVLPEAEAKPRRVNNH
jgi:hypothetical protein